MPLESVALAKSKLLIIFVGFALFEMDREEGLKIIRNGHKNKTLALDLSLQFREFNRI